MWRGGLRRPMPRWWRGSRPARWWRRTRPAGVSAGGAHGCGRLSASGSACTASPPVAASRTRPRSWGRGMRGCWSGTAGRRIASSPMRSIRRVWRICCAESASCWTTPSAAGQDPPCHPPHPPAGPCGPRPARRRPAHRVRGLGSGRAAGCRGRQAGGRAELLPTQPPAAGPSRPGARRAVHLPGPPGGAGDQLARGAGHPPRRGQPQGLGRQRHLGRRRVLADPGQRDADRCVAAARPGRCAGRAVARPRPSRGRPCIPGLARGP